MHTPPGPPGAPILIALPSGLVTSGVVAWAVRLVNAFANRGRLAGLLLHAPSRGYAPLDIALHYNVQVHDLSDLPPLDEANGDLSPYIPRYRDALHDLALKAGGPVALSPNLLGDCYGIAAAIAMVEPEVVRILGWAHVDLPYEVAILKHYEPAISRLVACSDVVRQRLLAAIPHREAHLSHVPYGVTIHANESPHEPYQGQRPLRLIYSGRVEQDVKRVGALVHLSDELSRRGIAHQLTILGDGPAAAEIDRACAARRSILRLPPVSSERVHAILEQQDIIVMASRVEGLSVSLLEAMACGCVPVITKTRSGSAEAVTHGVSGVLVDWEGANITDHAALGARLAEGVCQAVAQGLPRFAAAARASIRERFTHDTHVSRTMQLVDEIVSDQPRTWPASRPCAFTTSLSAGTESPAAQRASGTVPADAAQRLYATLAALQGRRIIIHGTGRHTLELQHALAPFTTQQPRANNSHSHAAPTIVAFTDDDPARQGSTLLGLPVLSPSAANSLNASDVVISSFINQDDIWQRRSVYESLGLKVHRLYPTRNVPSGSVPSRSLP
jgi:glycosyltransferase involved in cell wall biosynthesis